jgi:hypothetical protein
MTENGHRTPREQFGQVAVRKGYVTDLQVQDALGHQRRLSERGEKHKLIGMIMLELGLLGTTELIDVLKAMNLAYTHASPPPRPVVKA